MLFSFLNFGIGIAQPMKILFTVLNLPLLNELTLIFYFKFQSLLNSRHPVLYVVLKPEFCRKCLVNCD